MKFLRFLLNCLALVFALAVVLVGLAFVPAVQTWVAQLALARQPALQVTLGSLWARFGKIDVADFHLTVEGAVLTLPSLEAELPLTKAVWDRRVLVRRLVAKGWTLDLRRILPAKNAGEQKDAGEQAGSAPEVGAGTGTPAQAATEPAQSVTPQAVARIFRGTLSRWTLPCDVSLDGADLEGDVLFDAPAGKDPTRVHVIVKGGGLAAGREGAFAIDASCETLDIGPSEISLTGHGSLAIAMKSPRTFSRLEVKADLSAEGGPFPNGLALSADFTATLGAGEEIYSLDLSRGSQHLATMLAHFPEATNQFAGTWKLDVRDSDIAPFTPDRPLPHFTATGDGRFDADAAFTRVHALGRLSAAASNLGVLAPSLERFGAVTMDAGFDLARSGRSIRVDRLSVSLTGARPAAVVQSLQPFEFDEHTGELKPTDPAGDWMEISLRGFPLAWLAGPTDGIALSGGDATGQFVVRAEKGRFAVRSKAPLTAAEVSVQRAGRTIGRKLDLSLALLADYGPQGWQMQAAPLIVGSGGHRLGSLEVKAARSAAPDQPIAIAGAWNADLQALASAAVIPDFSWIGGRSASGDFSATVGNATELDAKLAVVGRDEHHSITASMHAEVDDSGAISFLAPVKVAFGPSMSDLSAEGRWIRDEEGTRLYVKLTGANVILEHLRLLAVPLAAAGGAPLAATGGPATPVRGRDRIPFWGDWTGRVTVAFDRLKAGDLLFDAVGGAFQVDHGSVRLEGGRGGLSAQRFANVEGSLSFDAAAEFPYSLKATASLDKVDAASLFPAPTPEGQPAIEGRFSVAGTLVGDGINFDDLVGRTHEELRLTSTNGIVRVLKTDVDEAIPQEAKTRAVPDALGRMGSAVGAFFGVEDSGGSGRKSVSPSAQTVIDFINQISEIGFDEITVTAIRGSDGTIRLVNIAMTASDERLTGSGQITFVKGLSLRAQPFSVDLQFWAHGGIAKLLSAAGLLSTQKDELGYALLNQPIHLGGTLEHIDKSRWHDLLVKAAARKPEAPKKDR